MTAGGYPSCGYSGTRVIVGYLCGDARDVDTLVKYVCYSVNSTSRDHSNIQHKIIASTGQTE